MSYLYIIQETGSEYGKFGICKKSNPSRILHGQTYCKNKLIVHNLYQINPNTDYELYRDYDKIISYIGKDPYKIKKVEQVYQISLNKLLLLKKFLIDEDGGTELFDMEGLNLLQDFIINELPLFRLSVEKLTNDEINQILQITNENIKKIVYEKFFDNIFETKLRFYQEVITKYILKYFESNKNIYLDLATGGGKSFIVFYILKVLKPDTIIIFSPRKKINQQNVSSKYVNYLGNDYNIFNYSNDDNFDNFINTYKKKLIVCCTQSADKLCNEIKNKTDNIFIWFDEAHWGVENWIRNDNKKYWLESNQIRYRLFTSASPDEKIVKTNLNYFGEYYKPFNVKYLIDNEYLCKIIPYMYETDQNNISMNSYILKHFKEKKRKYGFSFHNRDSNALKMFYRHYNEYSRKKTDIKPYLLIDDTNLDIEWSTILRHAIRLDYKFKNIDSFEKMGNCIAYVVKKYDMGYDFNKLDFITFSDPKLSGKDIIQCIGRGTRIYNEKVCHILLPIYVSEDITEYDKIINVLQYLINDVGIDFETVLTNSSNSGENEELICKNYDGTDVIKSIIIEKLNMTIKTTRQLEKICVKFNIYNETDYNKFKLENKFYSLKKNIYDYKGFKWKPIVDPKGEKYYDRNVDCENAINIIKYKIKNLSDDKEKQKKLVKLKISGNYYEYDIKIPPYNKLNECYY